MLDCVVGHQHLHALDMFGASRAVAKCWRKLFYKAEALDIQIGGQKHDILGREGFYNYLDHAMQLLLACK